MTAATACRTCGTEPREGARFCHGCGAPVTVQDGRAEYKQVTVLFGGLGHSGGGAAACVDVQERDGVDLQVRRGT